MAFAVIHEQVGRTGPSELMVYGERNSGTNLVHALLAQNLPVFQQSPGDRIGKYGFRYGWKHGFPQMLAAPAGCLAIAVFRHPETWVRSMHARPWHAGPDLKALTFDAFLRAQWHTRVDERNFGVNAGDMRAMAELQWDRHPLTGARFTSIAQLRQLKTTGFLSLSQRFANCLMLRHEDVVADPQGMVAHVAKVFGLDQKPDFQPVKTRRGKASDGPYQAQSYPGLSPEDRDWLWSELNHDQETHLGYAPLVAAPASKR